MEISVVPNINSSLAPPFMDVWLWTSVSLFSLIFPRHSKMCQMVKMLNFLKMSTEFQNHLSFITNPNNWTQIAHMLNLRKVKWNVLKQFELIGNYANLTEDLLKSSFTHYWLSDPQLCVKTLTCCFNKSSSPYV